MIARVLVAAWGGPAAAGSAEGSRRTWEERRGLVLALEDADGRRGLGEATPLPGLSPDTLEEATGALEAAPWGALERADPGAAPLRSIAGATGALPPSARFALESAWIDLVGRRTSAPAHCLLGAPEGRSVPRSALLGRLDGGEAGRAATAIERGATVLKIKVQGRDLEREGAALLALRRSLPEDVALRADLGGALGLASVPAWMDALAAAGVEAVEEPVSGRALLDLGPCAVPWLADESLVDPALAERVLAHPSAAGIVLKPTLLGGLGACLGLAERAHAAGKEVVVTHAFEGPVALAASAALALAARATLAGLDDHGALGAFPEAACASLPPGRPLAVRGASAPGLGLEALALPDARVLWTR